MITIYKFLTESVNAVSTDADVLAYIAANSLGPNTVLKMFTGDDAEDPAAQNDAPFIVAAPAALPFDLGVTTDKRQPSIDLDWGITGAIPVRTATSVTYPGLAKCDALGQLIYAAMLKRFGYYIGRANYLLYPAHPLYEGGMTITLNVETGMGEPDLPGT